MTPMNTDADTDLHSNGLTQLSSTTAEVASRSQAMVVGSTVSKSVLAMPAPNCTDTIPIRTSTTGDLSPRRTDRSVLTESP